MAPLRLMLVILKFLIFWGVLIEANKDSRPRIVFFGDESINLYSGPFDYVELHLVNLIRNLRQIRPADFQFFLYKSFGKNVRNISVIDHPLIRGAIVLASCQVTPVLMDDLIRKAKTLPVLRVDLTPCPAWANKTTNFTNILRAHPIPFNKRFHCLNVGILAWLDSVIVPKNTHSKQFPVPFKVNNTSLRLTLQECAGSQWKQTTVGTVVQIRQINDSIAKKQLNGTRLILSAIHRPPWIDVKRDADRNIIALSGYNIEFLKLLSQRLNFFYDVIIPTDNNCGGLDNDGTWSGMMGHLARLEADIAIGPIAMIGGRNEVSDFPATIYEELVVLIVPPPQETDKFLLYISPLNYEVWLLTAATAVLVGLTLWLAMYCLISINMQEWKFAFITAVFQSIGVTTGHIGFCMPRYLSACLVVALWLIMVVPVLYAYNGTLVSLLTVKKMEAPVKTLDELAKSDLEWIVRKGTSVETFVKEARREIFRQLREGTKPNNSLVSEREALAKVSNGTAVYLKEYVSATASVTADLKNVTYCRMVLGQEELFKTHVSFAMRKGSNYFAIVRKEMLKLQAMGILKYWEKYYWPLPNKCITRAVPTLAQRPLRMFDVYGAYIICGIGIFISILTFCGELATRRLKLMC